MRIKTTLAEFLARAVICLLLMASYAYAQAAARVQVDWAAVQETSKTTPTLQVVVNPPLRPGSKIHDRVYENLKALGADYVRYVPWLPYPKLAVAELEPPANGKTSWDFSLIDPMMEDFMNAQAGHSVIINFSTIPQWMWKTPKPVAYPSNPDQVDWNYEQGTDLRDPSMKEVADYYARLVGWYTQGGFTDEYGHRHESGHHYKIQYWEVLNEVDFEHHMSPEFYTRLYDAVTAAIHKVDPDIRFVGAALAAPSINPKFFEYFLNPQNHRAGAPLDMISYHFYASPTQGQDIHDWQYTFFDQAERFLDTVRYIQVIRERLRPRPRPTPMNSDAFCLTTRRTTWCGRFRTATGICAGRCTPICTRSWPSRGSKWPANRNWSVTRRSFRASRW